MKVLSNNPLSNLLGWRQPGLAGRQPAVSPPLLAHDQAHFGAAQSNRGKVPELSFVVKTIGEHSGSLQKSIVERGIKQDTLAFMEKPVWQTAATYNYYKNKAELKSGNRVSYFVYGNNQDGKETVAGEVAFAKDKPRSNWRFTALTIGFLDVRQRVFDAVKALSAQHPDAELHTVSGLPGTATSAIQSVLVQEKGKPAQVHVLGTTNSRYPGTYPEAKYPLKPGDILRKGEFVNKLNRIGRLDQERTLLGLLLASTLDAKFLGEIVGKSKVDALLQSIAQPRTLKGPEREAAVAAVIETHLTGSPINLIPYFQRLAQ